MKAHVADRIQIRQMFFIHEIYFGHVTTLSSLANDRANFRVRSQRKHKCAVPWMYLQIINIIDQSVALSIHLTHSQKQYDALEKSMWYIPVSSIYLSEYPSH